MSVRILEGNAPDVLRTLPAEHFHMCVTSPPYWALRRYGTEPQVWGGTEGCAHVWGDELRQSVRGAEAGATAKAGNTKARVCPTIRQQGAFCQSCGAWRGELGSEPTPELFITHLVSLFDEVWRVLRDDGTLWVNLGDSYWGGGGGNYLGSKESTISPSIRAGAHLTNVKNRPIPTARYRLRRDLTPEQEAYVLAELAKARAISPATQDGRE